VVVRRFTRAWMAVALVATLWPVACALNPRPEDPGLGGAPPFGGGIDNNGAGAGGALASSGSGGSSNVGSVPEPNDAGHRGRPDAAVKDGGANDARPSTTETRDASAPDARPGDGGRSATDGSAPNDTRDGATTRQADAQAD
jgi:hypothetical protein